MTILFEIGTVILPGNSKKKKKENKRDMILHACEETLICDFF